MMNRFAQFELVAVDLRNRNTRKQEILSQIVTNVAKYEFECFLHAYTTYHWQWQLVAQEMQTLESGNTTGN